MRSRLPILLLGFGLAAFALGIVHLFKLRFESGDVYPAYSSLRTDPLGTRAFFESLGLTPGVSARRDLSTANRLPDGKGTTYLHLAGRVTDWDELPESLFKEIDAFLARGGRLVIAFLPETRDPSRNILSEIKQAETKNERRAKPDKKQRQPKDETEGYLRMASVKRRWGIEFAFVDLPQGEQGVYESVPVRRSAGPRGAGPSNPPDSRPASQLEKSTLSELTLPD